MLVEASSITTLPMGEATATAAAADSTRVGTRPRQVSEGDV